MLSRDKCLFFKGFGHYLGKAVNEAYRTSKSEFYRQRPPGSLICALCGGKVHWKERSVDHIIPKSIIYETGLVGLYFDHRNFRITHKTCNTERQADIQDLPGPVLAKLKQLGYSS